MEGSKNENQEASVSTQLCAALRDAIGRSTVIIIAIVVVSIVVAGSAVQNAFDQTTNPFGSLVRR